MRIIGCDLHARQQTLAILDTETGEIAKMTLTHEGDNVREFYSALSRVIREAQTQKGAAPDPIDSSEKAISDVVGLY